MNMTTPDSAPPAQRELPATPWDTSLAWLVRGCWVSALTALVRLFLDGGRFTPLSAGLMSGAALAMAVSLVMGHLSCQCGGRLFRQAAYRVDSQGETCRMCLDCAGDPGQACPHGIPWAAWPCMTCAYPALFPEG